jgi:prepilin-type N-terminal cleavage/methylation domain-containing protein
MPPASTTEHSSGVSRAGALPSPAHHRRAAFTLIEVIIAVAIFAGAIVVIIGLFGPLNRSIGEVADNGRAARLADGINVELMRLRDTQSTTSGSKLDALATLVANGAVLNLVASADGSRVIRESDAVNDPLTGTPPGIATRDRYYLIEVRMQPAPLNYTAGTSTFLALTATVSWPYQVATGPTTSIPSVVSERQSLLFNYALTP